MSDPKMTACLAPFEAPAPAPSRGMDADEVATLSLDNALEACGLEFTQIQYEMFKLFISKAVNQGVMMGLIRYSNAIEGRDVA
ncbi:MAG: hypothetical protein ACXWPM_00740 [Bdellovibrionota bacterium]